MRKNKRDGFCAYEINEPKRPLIKNKQVFVMVCVMLSIILAAMAVLFSLAIKQSIRMYSFTPIKATIIGDREKTSSDGSIYYSAVYEYYLDGERHEYVDKIGSNTSSSINGTMIYEGNGGHAVIGQKVTLYINPQNPSDIMSKLETNFLYIGGFIAFLCFYAIFVMGVIVPQLGKFYNPGGLFGSTLFIMMGALLFFAPGLMNYARSFAEFFSIMPVLAVFGLIGMGFGIFGFCYELVQEISHRKRKYY